MSECVTSNAILVNSKTLPEWTKKHLVARFESWSVKREDGVFRGQSRILSEYISAIMTDSPAKQQARLTGQREDKAQLPWWQLTQLPQSYCGTDKGKRNGLLQLDLDAEHLPNGGRAKVDLDALKAAVIEYQGIIFAARSSGGHGVSCLLHAPDLELGTAYARQLADELRRRGFAIELDPKGSKPEWGRYETYDPSPYVAEHDSIIAMPAGEGLARHTAKPIFDLCGTTTHEGAIFAMSVAAISSRITFQAHGAALKASADVQLIGESGDGKTTFRIKPLQTIAEQVGTRQPGGIRTTDAALMDALIYAAYDVQRDDKDKVITAVLRPFPQKLAFIRDENGEVERATGTDPNKALMNVIRREAFSGAVEIGSTKEMMKEYRGLIDGTVPADVTFYRSCTQEQLRIEAAADKAGNGRRVLYAQFPKIEYDLQGRRAEQQKRARDISTPEKMQRFHELASNIQTALANRTISIAPDAEASSAAMAAARHALRSAGIADGWQDTMIYNAAALLAAVRIGFTFHDTFDAPLTISAEDIYAAADVAIESNRIRVALTSHGLAEALVMARTAGERTDKLIEYIASCGKVRRDKLIKRIGTGKQASDMLDGLCEEGILSYAIETSGGQARGWYSVTPEDDVEAAKASYAEFRQRKEQPRGAAKGKARRTTAERCDSYRNTLASGKDGKPPVTPESCGGNDNYLRTLAGKIKANNDLMSDASGVERWFENLVISGEFNEQGERPYTAKDAKRLFRDGNLTLIA